MARLAPPGVERSQGPSCWGAYSPLIWRTVPPVPAPKCTAVTTRMDPGLSRCQRLSVMSKSQSKVQVETDYILFFH